MDAHHLQFAQRLLVQLQGLAAVQAEVQSHGVTAARQAEAQAKTGGRGGDWGWRGQWS